jgi:hypothetical protein
MKEPTSVHSDEIRRFAEPAEPEEPQAQPNVVLMFACGLILMIIFLGVRAFIFEPPTPVPAQALPTATTPRDIEEQADWQLVDQAVTPLEADAQADGPTADAEPLPATLPAGVTQGDLSLTVYQGWPWRYGGRSGDHCMIEVWPAGRGPREQVWIMCVLLNL